MSYLLWKRKDRTEDEAVSRGVTTASPNQGAIYVYQNRFTSFFGLIITVCLPYSLFLDKRVYYDFLVPVLQLYVEDMRER